MANEAPCHTVHNAPTLNKLMIRALRPPASMNKGMMLEAPRAGQPLGGFRIRECVLRWC